MAEDPTIAELTKQYFIENYKRARDEMKLQQSAKIGYQKRSQQASDMIVERLHTLPPQLRQTIMELIAKQAGHEDGEQQQCELCQFLSQQVGKKWAQLAT